MKAAVVTDFAQPLEIQDRPVPEPGPGQVLVRIAACGLCHTDIHAAHGDWPVKPSPPFVPGHEGVGIVEQVGRDVTAREVGDRVAIPWLGHACGRCGYCISGWETLCEQQQNSGYGIDGAFAEYAVADADFVVPVPDAVSSFDAAPLTCAGVTTYKAIKVAHIRPAEKVAIFGVGGLGHLAVQYARLVGGIVVAVDVDDTKLELARSLGADHTVNAATNDPVAALEELGGIDVAVVTAVIPAVFEQAFACAPSRWPAGLRRPSARDRRPDEPADLPDRAQGHLGDRLDRRHPSGPGRGLRAARPRTDEGHRREPQARRGQRVDRRRARGPYARRGWSSSSERAIGRARAGRRSARLGRPLLAALGRRRTRGAPVRPGCSSGCRPRATTAAAQPLFHSALEIVRRRHALRHRDGPGLERHELLPGRGRRRAGRAASARPTAGLPVRGAVLAGGPDPGRGMGGGESAAPRTDEAATVARLLAQVATSARAHLGAGRPR